MKTNEVCSQRKFEFVYENMVFMSLLLHVPLFYSCQKHTQFLTRTWDIRSFITATNLLHLRILRVFALLRYFEFYSDISTMSTNFICSSNNT